MLINLITDSEVQRPGFSAMYLAVPKSKGRRAYESLVFIHPHVFIPALLIVFFFFPVVKCNTTLTADKGVITSPLHPSFYPPAVDCKWTIKVCSPPSLPTHPPIPCPALFLHQRSAEAALWEPSCSVAPLSSSIRTLLLQQLSTMLLGASDVCVFCVCTCFTHSLFGCTSSLSAFISTWYR